MKNLEEIQSIFNLFEIGDEVIVSIFCYTEDGLAKVKTSGGCFGKLSTVLPKEMKIGTSIKTTAVDILDGLHV